MNKRNLKYYLAVFVALLTFVVYLPALRNEFVVWDDDLYVYNNLHIRAFDPAFFRWAFSYSTSVGFWHPVAWLSHALDYALWGLNPAGHHLSNVMLHAANTFIVVLLAIKLLEFYVRMWTGRKRSSFPDGRAILIAAGVSGILFGLHPLRVESVAWVSERKDLLYALFYLMSIMAYTEYVILRRKSMEQAVDLSVPSFIRGPGKMMDACILYVLSLVLFILSLASKPMAVTLPVVLLLLDWYPFGRISSWRGFFISLKEKAPFIILALLVSIVTLVAQKAVGAMAPLDTIPLTARALMAFKSLTMYIWKMVLPINLLPLYPIPRNIFFLSVEYLPSVALVCLITAVCVAMRKKQQWWLAVWGYYVISLFPVLGFFQSGLHSMADRFTYLPALGLFFISGLGAAWLWAKTDSLRKSGPVVRRIIVVAAMLLIICMSYLTLKQISLWKNTIDLWSYVIGKEPDQVPLAYNNRGVAFREKGQLGRALEDYDKAIMLDPSEAKYYTNRGIVFGETGQVGLALADFDKAINLAPDYADAYTSRGLAFAETGQIRRAMEDYDRAIRLNPSSVEAYLNRGLAFARMEQFDRAIADYDKAVALDPSDYLAYSNRGLSYSRMGQEDKAIGDYTRAISLKPDSGKTYMDRGNLYLKTGNPEFAIRDFQKACELGNEQGCRASGLRQKP